MPTASPGSAANYTIGANELLIGAATVGYVVTAAITPTLSYLSRFSATEGKDIEDLLSPDTLAISMTITMHEVATENLRRFFLADSAGIVGKLPIQRSALTFKGVAVVGNNLTWTIPDAILSPEGSFGYQDQDWTQFAIKAVIRPARGTASPWGTIIEAAL